MLIKKRCKKRKRWRQSAELPVRVGVLCHLCLEKKRKKSHTGPLSHFYGNLKAIIVPCHSLWKDFSWRGARWGGEMGGQCGAFSLLTAGKQKEKEWMSERKSPLCSARRTVHWRLQYKFINARDFLLTISACMSNVQYRNCSLLWAF